MSRSSVSARCAARSFLCASASASFASTSFLPSVVCAVPTAPPAAASGDLVVDFFADADIFVVAFPPPPPTSRSSVANALRSDYTASFLSFTSSSSA